MRHPQPGTWHADPAHFRRPSRRGFLQVGAVGALGLTLGDYFRVRAADQAPKAKAQGLIHIFLPGGCAHQETWDPKPYSPMEYRGDMGVVPTKLDGVVFSEAMKQCAGIADKITVIRSMTHGEADHDRGTHNMFTGWKPSPALVYPSMGSIVAHELGVRNNLPPYVCVPNQPTKFAASGYLSSSFGPFSLGADPANQNFQVRDLTLPNGVDEKRFTTRKDILAAVNDHFASAEKSDQLAAMDTFYSRAYGMISSPAARSAFDINAEPANIRDEYGRNAAGQRMLMARRLIQAGVRFVSLTYGGWDMHANIAQSVRAQLPPFDQAFAALIRDLDRTGMLDTTMVMVSSEFGRTPKINGTAGRDHWPKVFSVVLAGGGIKKGSIYGSSDPTASEPQDDPMNIEDLAFTVFHQLGIQPEKKLMAPGSRPIIIVDDGKLRKDLLA
ncbi:MAG: DUF1501 domain-containing protein [Gemmataceae bacterium]|nr:DUF1501 domain-containing protein [Gemmataceae bacterium]